VGRRRSGWPLVLLVVAACGPEDPRGPPPPEAPVVPGTAEVAEPGEVPPPSPPPSAGPLAATGGAFPHGEHGSVRCRSCHTSLPSHLTHGDVECTACHGVPAGYATLPIRSAEDCLACHHDRGRETPCTTCHAPEGAGPVRTLATLRLSPAAPGRERTLDFPHDRHSTVDCTTCHTEGVRYDVTRACSSCHESHHRPDAPCLSCHEPAGDRHGPEVHLGCRGATCHGRADLEDLARARPTCLTCHPGQSLHEPGRDCAACHAMGRPS